MTFLDTNASIFDVSVSRSGPDVLRISWKTTHKNLQIAIYHGTTPETTQRKISFKFVKDQTAVIISKLNPDVPHYFKVAPEAGKAIIVGERRLPLQKTVNSRDLGGYETADGHRIKWGKVFRSDHLARLSTDDIAFLKQLKIQTVCDFRTLAEVRSRPDDHGQRRSPGSDQRRVLGRPRARDLLPGRAA